MATTFKLYADKMGATDPTTYIGRDGDIFYDPDSGALKRSDGVTPGGIPITSEGLTVQDDTLTSDYYIYVGNPANKLSSFQDYRRINTGFTYDQEFTHLDQAFKFIMENPLDEAGYADYIGANRKASYVIALEENATHTTNPVIGHYGFHLWNVNSQVVLLNQNALSTTPATAECYAVIDDDLKLWGIPLFQLATYDLRFTGEIDCQGHVHMRTASNVSGFANSIIENSIRLRDSYALLNGFEMKPSSTFCRIDISDNSVLDMNPGANIDQTNGSFEIRAYTNSFLIYRTGGESVPFKRIIASDSTILMSNANLIMEEYISLGDSRLTLAGQLTSNQGQITFNTASAKLSLGRNSQLTYTSLIDVGFGTSHQIGGKTVAYNDPLLFLHKTNWEDGIITVNTGATQNTIGQSEGTFRLPSIDTTARNALTPANGDMIYNTTDSKLQGYQAGAWINIDGT